IRTFEAMLASEAVRLTPALLAGMIEQAVSFGLGEQLARMLLDMGPALPGIAGRYEALRLLSLLNGALVKAKGNPMFEADGVPLKLDDLLYFSLLGGLLNASADDGRFAARLSPLVLYGFDSIFSLIGFDGRALTLPRYLAVQVKVNSGKPQFAYGQTPFSE